jgi:tetratricopeptide (TPR) repeat protein
MKRVILWIFIATVIIFAHGPNHNKAEEAKKRGDYKSAMKFSLLQLSEDFKEFGHYTRETMITFSRLGIYTEKLKKYPLSLAYTFEALKIQDKILETNDVMKATSYNNIGGVYSKLKKYKKALAYYFNSLKMQELLFGMKHRTLAITYNNIAKVYRKQSRYSEALKYYSKSLKIREDTLDKNDYSIALMHSNIGLVYFKQGVHDKALEALDKALRIRIHIFGKSHSFTKKTQKNIDYIQSKIVK